MAKTQQTAKAEQSQAAEAQPAVLKRVRLEVVAAHVFSEKEAQSVGSPDYILLLSSICSYHSSTRLHQLSQYLYISRRQSIEKLKRKVKVIRLKLLLMSFQ